jgi:hypothetical protein
MFYYGPTCSLYVPYHISEERYDTVVCSSSLKGAVTSGRTDSALKTRGKKGQVFLVHVINAYGGGKGCISIHSLPRH